VLEFSGKFRPHNTQEPGQEPAIPAEIPETCLVVIVVNFSFVLTHQSSFTLLSPTMTSWNRERNASPEGVATMIMLCPAQERTARELHELPVEEREKVWADMSGNSNTTTYSINPEEESFLQEKLDQLEIEVSTISEKEVFDQTRRTFPDYVNSRSFRLLFLRSTSFDATLAATKMTRHFEEKLILFGEETLGRDILQSDLSSDDLDSLHCGGMQILQGAERAGRTIMYSRYTSLRFKTPENMVRAVICLTT
jgi:hypothetical protein